MEKESCRMLLLEYRGSYGQFLKDTPFFLKYHCFSIIFIIVLRKNGINTFILKKNQCRKGRSLKYTSIVMNLSRNISLAAIRGNQEAFAPNVLIA